MYDGSNLNPEYWSKYLEYYLYFQDEFDSIINNSNVMEADADFTLDVFDNTELEITRYGEMGMNFPK